jgi:ribonuclease J
MVSVRIIQRSRWSRCDGSDLPVHVSGHATQEELKLLLNMVQPQYVVPFHGDYRHMMRYKQLAVGMGFRGERVLLAEAGAVMEFGTPRAGITGHTPVGHVYVNGVTVGGIGQIVVRDRQQLAKDGIVMVVISVDQQQGTLLAGPTILSRGFSALQEGSPLLADTEAAVRAVFSQGYTAPAREVSDGDVATEGNAPLVSSPLVQTLKDAVGRVLFTRTRRSPMIIPVVMDV